MTVLNSEQPETVRLVAIHIGDETFTAKWDKGIPHAEAMRRVRIMLGTFDREPMKEPTDGR